MHAKKINRGIVVAFALLSVLFLSGFVPYTNDANTVLIDHFDGSTGANILGYQYVAACGSEKPSATPVSAFVSGPGGLGQALSLAPPAGQPAGSTTYLKYSGGELLSRPNGTIEFWVYLASYGTGVTLVSQGPFPGSCAGWTFGMSVSVTGTLQAGAWMAFNMNSGDVKVPLNAWTHVAATWGSAGAKLYINGVLVGSDANTSSPAGGYGGSVMVNYAAGSVTTQIDELRISNIQRSFTPPFSVDVTGLSYADNSGRSVVYDFAQRTLLNNALQIPEGSVTREGTETDTTYLWGDASAILSGIPGVVVVPDATLPKATVSPAIVGSEGVAALFTYGAVPAASGTVSWDYTIDLWNFNVDLSAPKVYWFNISLGRPAQDYNEACVEVLWVKGSYDGAIYPNPTLIVQAVVRNSGTRIWSSAPIVRTGLSPATTSVALQLHVTGGNHFAASANINNGGSQSLDAPGYTLPSGSFLRFPDLYPVLSLGEESQTSVDPFSVLSWHEQSTGSYGVGLGVYDPGQTLYSAVTVQSTNRGVAEPGYLVPTAMVFSGSMWNLPLNTPLILGTSLPGFYPSYHFAATGNDPANDATSDKGVTGYVTDFVNITSPLPASGASVSSAPTISWTWPGAAPVAFYQVFVNDMTAGGNQVWSNFNVPSTQTSILYPGPLVNGHNYQYTVIATVNTNNVGNQSLVHGTFTYTGVSTVLTFNGAVKTVPDWPAVDTAATVSGASVSAYLAGTPPTLLNTVAVDGSTGTFSLTGIPKSTDFFLLVQPPSGGGYAPVLSKFMNWTADIDGLLPFALFTTGPTGQYASFGNPSGTGMVLGRVALRDAPLTFLSGATIVATQYQNGAPTGTTYDVTYSGGGSSTGADGVYMVKNIPAGTGVQLTATLPGHTFEFNNAVVPVQTNFVSEESFFATAYTPISFSGVVQKYSDESLYSGATVALVGAESTVNTTTGADGAFTLGGLPAGTEFSVKIMGDETYVPTYTRVITSTGGVVADRNYNLFTQANLTTWGVSGGSGVIRGRIINSENTGAGYVSGAVVTYSSQLGRTDYVVKYEDQFNVLSTGTGTTANGKYYILNVAEGDTVTVTATHPYYTFPLLTDGNARKFNTHANAVSEAIIKGTRVAGRVAIGGYIKDGNSVAIKGATIEQVGQTSPLNATVSNADGAYYMTVPQGANFYLKFSKPQATPTVPAPTYTAEMFFTADALSLGENNLFPPSKLTNSVASGGWGNTSGKGIIRARVKDNTGTNLGGATVSYTSSLLQTYTVCYDDGCTSTNLNGGTTPATGDIGRYVIKNVEPNDTVTVTAAREGYTFSSRVFHAYANSLHQGSPAGTPQDESTIRSRFDAMLTEYNKGAAGNIDTVMAYFSANFLDDGYDKAARRADMLAGMTAGETRNYSGVTVTISGDGLSAVMVVTWNGGDIETIYLAKEGGIWLIIGNQARHSVGVQSQHWGDGYHAGFYVEDTPATPALTSVTVTGPGITGSLALTYDTFSGNWYPMTGQPFLGTTPPAGPLTYTITVTEGSTDYPYTRTITGHVTEFASISSPFNTFGSPVVFSWRGIPGASGYRVELSNDQGQRIWEKGRIPRNQWGAFYDGAPLESGKTYTYIIVSEIATGDGRNMSMAQGSFTYSGSAQPTVSYGNYVADINGNPLEGAQIEQWNAPLDSVTSSAADGSFTLGNILARTPVHLKFSMASGYVPTYSAYMGFASNTFDSLGFYNLFTQAEFDAMSVEAGKGVIRGVVRDANRNRLAGATITAWSAQGSIYEIRYYDDMVTTYRTTDGTYPSGRFAIMNVAEGDKVVASAQLGGFTFSSPKGYAGHSGAVTQGGFSASNSCAYTFNPASVSVALEGNGAGSTFTVTTSAACTWTAVSNNADWLHITGAASGAGSGSVGYTVDANAGSARTGTITVGGQTFTVNQGTDTVTLQAASQAFNSATAGGGSVNVTATAGTAWTAVSNHGWITIISGQSGSGNGTVNFSVAANPGTTARVGTITVGGQTFTVTQAGTIVPPWAGVWGAMTLNRDNVGNWYTESTRFTLNIDGTGSAAATQNDGAQAVGLRIATFTETFSHTASTNTDGSHELTLTFTADPTHPKIIRLVFADSGNVAVIDGTTSDFLVKFSTLVRIDPTKTYSNGDVNGPYYHVGYEHNVDGGQLDLPGRPRRDLG
jgi:hypothetical protein